MKILYNFSIQICARALQASATLVFLLGIGPAGFATSCLQNQVGASECTRASGACAHGLVCGLACEFRYRHLSLPVVVSANGARKAVSKIEDWELFFQDKHITIEYRLAECNDAVNGLSVDFYIMRIKNNSDKRVNLTYVLGEGDSRSDEVTLKDQESYCSLILQPGETIEAKCPNPDRMLSLFVRDRIWSKESMQTKFAISKIHVYEI